ncbi:MAG TPA: ATP-binding protein [Hyphomicrobiales bacterium]|nr:ATP-binding protein [Hyphomicrobiales bacterium]
MTTTDLYPYLIIIGSSILVAAGWLLHQYRKQQNLTRELIQLNEQLGYDLPNFLDRCWPLLKRSGFSGLHWELDWFGTTVNGTYGSDGGKTQQAIEKRFKVQEIALTIHLLRDRPLWEQRYFSDAQAENFFLLVQMNVWIKIGTIQGAFEQTAKMTVFLKHDVKNMVQLLTLSAEQLQDDAPQRQDGLLQDLRETVPALRERAEHMLRALSDKPTWPRNGAIERSKPTLRLEELLQQTAALYDLPATISGSAQLALEKELLLGVIDNLLSNYSQLARRHPARPVQLDMHITQENDQVCISIEDLHGPPFPRPERLFEPFWSEHGSGRGIGLYQARQQLTALGGELSALAPSDGPLRFLIRLPAAC